MSPRMVADNSDYSKDQSILKPATMGKKDKEFQQILSALKKGQKVENLDWNHPEKKVNWQFKIAYTERGEEE